MNGNHTVNPLNHKKVTRPPAKRSRRQLVNKRTAPYLFIAPAVLLFVVFTLYPVVSSLILSFQSRIGGHYVFSGFHNYIRLFHDPMFYKALENTGIILFIQVPIQLMLAVLIAVALNSGMLRAKGLFRIAYFMPAVTSLVAASIVFLLLLDENYGLLNFILVHLGLPKINWLSDPFWAKVSLMLVITWRWTGYNMVIFLAGLQNISHELYEASSIDGAGKVRQFFFITMPLLKPIFLFTAVLSTIGTLQLFDEPYTMTEGGPNNATLTITLYLYQNGFKYFDFGYASAIAYILVLLIAILSWIQMKVAGDEE